MAGVKLTTFLMFHQFVGYSVSIEIISFPVYSTVEDSIVPVSPHSSPFPAFCDLSDINPIPEFAGHDRSQVGVRAGYFWHGGI